MGQIYGVVMVSNGCDDVSMRSEFDRESLGRFGRLSRRIKGKETVSDDYFDSIKANEPRT